MKRRGLSSPDIADALALTFARPVFPRAVDDWMGTGSQNCISDYDPFSREALRGEPYPESRKKFYAAGWEGNRLRSEFENRSE